MLEYQAPVEAAFAFVKRISCEVFVENIVAPDFCSVREKLVRVLQGAIGDIQAFAAGGLSIVGEPRRSAGCNMASQRTG